MNKPKELIRFSKTITGEETSGIIRVRMGTKFLLTFDNVQKEILHSECSNPTWLISKLIAL